jgi:N-acetyl-gamma-glutamyl-phosphate reductase
MIRAAIVGATGFTGEKLIEILAHHPDVKIVNMSCRVEKPKPVAEAYPRFKSLVDGDLVPIDADDIVKKADVVFLSLPHTISFQYVPKFLAAGKTVIDLSADYRLRDAAVYNKFYNVEHTDIGNIKNAVYGLPELYKSRIKKARLVANPGCYPTAVTLGLAPLVKNGFAQNIIIDAKSGITGAGRKASTELLYTAISGNMYAYKVFKHQHVPEMEQTLSDIAGKKTEIVFTPHVIPMEQGILATIYADLPDGATKESMYELYRKFYADAPFVRLYKDGLPKLKDVFNTNYCDIGFEISKNKIVIVSCIDNLMKGASSQAVQNMNIVCGLDEKAGLR